MCTRAEDSLSVTEIDGRGRSLIATKPLKGGEIILRDAPLLLYSALPSTEQNHPYCHRCFRRISPNSVITACPHQFCGLDCYSKAITTSHTPFVCQFLSHLSKTPFPHDLLVQSRFIVAACNLSVSSPRNFELLLSLQGNYENSNVESAKLICSFLDSFAGKSCFSLEMTSALLAKDKLNAFGLMESKEKRWSVRAYGVYYKAAMFNHDCLPNACRFDYVDSEREDNTEIVVRMIHDVPEGREICLSYFPVNLSYKERQKRLLEDYGFTCCCDRCKVESNWSDDEEEEVEGEGQGSNGENEEEAMDKDEDEDEEMENGEEEEDVNEDNNDFPHAYFFARYMCDRNNCWGTMAPLPPSSGSATSDVLECNVCGNIKKDEVVAAAADANSGHC